MSGWVGEDGGGQVGSECGQGGAAGAVEVDVQVTSSTSASGSPCHNANASASNATWSPAGRTLARVTKLGEHTGIDPTDEQVADRRPFDVDGVAGVGLQSEG